MAVVLVGLWFWMYLGRPFNIPSHMPWDQYSNSIQDTSGYELFNDGPVDSEAIRSICNDANWTPGLVFTCDHSFGGVGNIRNSILNCVRYAIAAGASLTLPRIVLRNPTEISNIHTKNLTSMDYMFNKAHFVQSLELSCPQLRLYNNIDEIPNRRHAQAPIPLLPESIVGEIPITGLKHPEAWQQTFFTWLKEHANPTNDQPVIIDLERSYLQYPIYPDGEGFAMSFGQVLQFRDDVRALATKTLLEMASKYRFTIDRSEPIAKQAFFGVHLRTEMDAVAGWPPSDWEYSRYETQSKYYLQQATRSGVSVIYVASGDANETVKFATDAATAAGSYSVETKFNLLKGSDKALMEGLAWDQQALIDFLVLLKGSDFAGVAHSSFAWNVALKRHQYSTESSYLDGPQMLSDELSQIYGKPRGYPEYALCMWP
jgi:hypothetical protein